MGWNEIKIHEYNELNTLLQYENMQRRSVCLHEIATADRLKKIEDLKEEINWMKKIIL